MASASLEPPTGQLSDIFYVTAVPVVVVVVVVVVFGARMLSEINIQVSKLRVVDVCCVLAMLSSRDF